MTLLFVGVASLVLGAGVMRALGLDHVREARFYGMLVGLSLCALIEVTLGSVQLRIPLLVMFPIAVAGLLRWYRSPSTTPPKGEDSAQEPLSGIERIAAAVIAAALGLAALSALAPATSWEACAAYLALPADYCREGRIYLNAGNPNSAVPHLMLALNTAVLYLGAELSVSVLNVLMAGLACASVFQLGRRTGGRRCGWIAAAIFAAAPIFMEQAGGVSVDLIFVAFTTAALTALLAWREERGNGWFLLSALLAGSACGVRVTGYLVCLLLAFGVLFGADARRLRNAALFLGVSLAAASPWLLRSALFAGNSAFPAWFAAAPAAGMDHAVNEAVGVGGAGLAALVRFPWDVVMRPGLYGGWTKSPGGLVLALGVPGLMVGGIRAWRLGAFSMAGGLGLFFVQRSAQGLLPFFTPMMAVAALAESRLRVLRKGIAVLLTVSFAYGLVGDAFTLRSRIPVLLGRETREDYLERCVERCRAFKYANENLHDGVILTPDPRSYFLDAPAYQNPFGMKALVGKSIDEQMGWLKTHKIAYVMMPVTAMFESVTLRNDVASALNAWRADKQHFFLLESMDLPRRNGDGHERVEFYRVLHDANP
jgi:hypothetical protein